MSKMTITKNDLFQKLNPNYSKEEYNIENFFSDVIDNNLTIWQLLSIEYFINKRNRPSFIIKTINKNDEYYINKIYDDYDSARISARSGECLNYTSFPEYCWTNLFNIIEIEYQNV